jgi:hypothetical protein
MIVVYKMYLKEEVTQLQLVKSFIKFEDIYQYCLKANQFIS